MKKQKAKARKLPAIQDRTPDELVAFGINRLRKLARPSRYAGKGEGDNAIARRRRAIAAGKVQVTAALLCLLLVLPLAGCFGGGTAADQLATANYEISGFIGDAQTAIRDALKLRIIPPEKALAAATAIQRGNLTQQKLLTELVKRLQPNGDREELVLTEGDKGMLVGLVNLLSSTAAEIVNDPDVLNLDSSTRAGVIAAIVGIQPIAAQLIGLIQKAPTQKKIAPSLRQQLQNATIQAEAARTNNDRLFAALMMETAR